MKAQPALFLAHGSPMNALANNRYTQRLAALGETWEKPDAVLVISAHWETDGSFVTHMQHPRTIHDFGGFPDALYAVEYPAPGSPKVAERVREVVREGMKDKVIGLDDTCWGLDHGTWSVLRHVFPKADVPVVQLSMDKKMTPREHLALGEALRSLRNEGVMIVGSGNVTHNLRRIDWKGEAPPPDWAVRFESWVKEKLRAREGLALADGFRATRDGQIAVPTPEHFLPLLYVLGASDAGDRLAYEYEAMELGSLSMLCVSFSS